MVGLGTYYLWTRGQTCISLYLVELSFTNTYLCLIHNERPCYIPQVMFNRNFKIIVFWGEVPCGLMDMYRVIEKDEWDLKLL
jgi:hypothetical protein